MRRIGEKSEAILQRYAATAAWHRTLRFLFCALADKDSPEAAIDGFKSLLAHLELLPEGRAVRLPTEEQWEKAARGNDGREFPWGEFASGRANIDETWDNAGAHYLRQTSAVGLYLAGASPCGALDMAGNVWEWCLNEYDKPERQVGKGDARRVVRGGSWGHGRGYARCAYRLARPPGSRGSALGLRLVCVAPIA